MEDLHYSVQTKFQDSTTLELSDSTILKAEKIIISTGSRFHASCARIGSVTFKTSDEVLYYLRSLRRWCWEEALSPGTAQFLRRIDRGLLCQSEYILRNFGKSIRLCSKLEDEGMIVETESQ